MHVRPIHHVQLTIITLLFPLFTAIQSFCALNSLIYYISNVIIKKTDKNTSNIKEQDMIIEGTLISSCMFHNAGTAQCRYTQLRWHAKAY